MKKKLMVLMTALVFLTKARAQDKMETDRPTEAQSAQVVSKGSLQAELGLRKEKQDAEAYTLQHPDMLIRFGVLNKVELRLRTSFETEHAENTFYGIKPLEVGIKAKVFQAKDSSFTATLYSHVGIPALASEAFMPEHAFYRVRLLFENEFTKKLKLNYNIGREWNDNEHEQTWLYAISPQMELTKKWRAFAEEYAFVEGGSRPEHYADAGIAYMPNPHLQLDIDAGKGLSDKSSRYFITAGVSIKF